MAIFLIIIVGLALCGCKIHLLDFNAEYMTKSQTNVIKGVFILLVFMGHIQSPYVIDSGYKYCSLMDKAYLVVGNWLGQCVVAPFLFYSGYGVMRQIMVKGRGYVRSIPVKRVFITLLNFDVAVVLFLLVWR